MKQPTVHDSTLMTGFASMQQIAVADTVGMVHVFPVITLTQAVLAHLATGCWF